MAAKSKAKPKKAAVSKTTAKTKVQKAKKPTAGMTAAQVKAYNSASKAQTKAAKIQANAKSYRSKRLATAKRTEAAARALYKSAASARTVAYATRRSSAQAISQHQTASLRKAAAYRVFNATRIASSRKFQAAGEALHARQNTLQTVTADQAIAVERRLSAKATITAKRRSAKTRKTTKTKSTSTKKKGLSQAAVKAGLSAASKVKSAKTAAKPKASVITPAVNSEWVTAGNDQGVDNCLPVAIANHLLAWTNFRLDDDQVNLIQGETVYDALRFLEETDPFDNVHVEVFAELTDTHHDIPGSLICFETPKRIEHAGLLIGSGVVSWGEVSPMPEAISEAWYIRWRTHG